MSDDFEEVSRIYPEGDFWVGEFDGGRSRGESPGSMVGSLVDIWMDDAGDGDGAELLSKLRLRTSGTDLLVGLHRPAVWEPCWTPSVLERELWNHVAARLRSLVQSTHDRLCTSAGWRAVEGSRATNDLSDTSSWIGHVDCVDCDGYFTWMRGRTAWAIGHYLLDGCLALSATLDSDPPTVVAWQSSARDLLETAGQVCWLVEEVPLVSIKKKVLTREARWFLVEWKSATERQRHLGEGADDLDRLRLAAAHFGIGLGDDDRASIGDVIDSPLPRPSAMPEFAQREVVDSTDWTDDDWLKGGSVYKANYSAVTHSRLYAIRDFREAEDWDRVATNFRLCALALASAEAALSRLSWYLTGDGGATGLRDDQRALRNHWLEMCD